MPVEALAHTFSPAPIVRYLHHLFTMKLPCSDGKQVRREGLSLICAHSCRHDTLSQYNWLHCCLQVSRSETQRLLQSVHVLFLEFNHHHKCKEMTNSILEGAALYFLYGKKYQLKVKVRKMISLCRNGGLRLSWFGTFRFKDNISIMCIICIYL